MLKRCGLFIYSIDSIFARFAIWVLYKIKWLSKKKAILRKSLRFRRILSFQQYADQLGRFRPTGAFFRLKEHLAAADAAVDQTCLLQGGYGG